MPSSLLFSSARAAASSLLLLVVHLFAPGASAESIEQALSDLRAAEMDPTAAVELADVDLDLGGATFRVERGRAFPVRRPLPGSAGGESAVHEVVFLGEGRLLVEPPDAIEAGQLELFTGEPEIDQEVREAVFVFADPTAAGALLAGPSRAADREGESEEASRARSVYTSWKDGAERRVLGVETALLRAALGDASQRAFVAARLETADFGRVLYALDPEAREQVTLGQFVPLDLTTREERKTRKVIHRQQRQGRLIGVELEDLGAWDTWSSFSLRDAEGRLVPGADAFGPEHYELDLSLDGRELEEGRGIARIRLKARRDGARILSLSLSRRLTVTAVRGAGGERLPFHQQGSDVVALLPAARAEGASTQVEVSYEGRIIDKLRSGIFELADPLAWYPRVSGLDRATYDVTLRYPDHLKLVGSGETVESDREASGRLRQRRVLNIPSLGFSFELGRFRFFERTKGGVRIRVAVDPLMKRYDRNAGELFAAVVAEVLGYYENLYGSYPLDQLEVATTFRSYSQAPGFGFLTLSNRMTVQPLEVHRLIAHEVAHQWWGNRIGWEGYRGQWISEALAHYSSHLYVRRRFPTNGSVRTPIDGWQEALFARLDDGRRVESVGPIVLGERLSSTRAGAAYPVTYLKGSLVFGSLAQQLGEEALLEALASLLRDHSYEDLSTEQFLAAMERSTGVDLDEFAHRFIYGTGLPEIYSTHRFVEGENGAWRVEGQTRTTLPIPYRYRAVRHRETGRLDAARRPPEPTRQPEEPEEPGAEDALLTVPYYLTVWDPDGEIPEHMDAAEAEARGNQLVRGRLRLTGSVTDWQIDLTLEPKGFYLDLGKEVLALLLDPSRFPKRALYFEALDAENAGEVEKALTLAREALEVPYYRSPSLEEQGFIEPVEPADPTGLSRRKRRKLQRMREEWERLERERESDRELFAKPAAELDGSLHLLAARWHLDAGRPAAARQSLEAAREDLEQTFSPETRYGLTITEARTELQEGNAERAYRSLLRLVRLKGPADPTEAWLLLAIAASETGHRDMAAEAVEEAQARGAEVELLRRELGTP